MRRCVAARCDAVWRFALAFDRFLEKCLGRSGVSRGAAPAIDGVAGSIQRPVEISPPAADFQVGFIDAP